MRNLAQYPITQAEMLQALDEAIQIVGPRGIGDIRQLALRCARDLIAETTAERLARRMGGTFVPFPASGIEAATADETAQQAQPEARARPDAQTPPQSPSYSKYRGSVE